MRKMIDFFKKHILNDAKTACLTVIILILGIAAVLMLCIGGGAPQANEINVVKDGYSYTLLLTDDELGTVEEAVKACGIELCEGDTLNCLPSDEASEVGVIVINSAVKSESAKINTDTLVVFEEAEPETYTNEPVIERSEPEDEPEENSSNELLPADEDEAVSNETEEAEAPHGPTDVPNITIDYIDVDEKIPFETVYKYDTSMKKGDVRIENGQDGIRTKVYEITFVDGVEESRKLVATKTKKSPVPKTVYEGTISSEVSSRGEKFAYTKVLKCMATAYTNDAVWGDHIAFSYLCGGGLRTRWGVIAVDPSVIPAGTKLYVKSLNGMKDYGYAIAADTGGSIIGNKIDLWMDDGDLCNVWGVKNVEVYVLEDQSADIFALRGSDEWTY